MYLRYAFIADNVSIDVNGKLNAIGIFDKVISHVFPSIHRDLTIVINMEGTHAEKGAHKLSIELRDSESNRLVAFDQVVELKHSASIQGILNGQFILKLQDVPFQKQGQYEFVIFMDDRFLGRIIFHAQKIEIQEAGEA